MRLCLLSLFAAPVAFAALAVPGLAQQPATGSAASPTASSILAPSLSQISSALSDVRLDKWKTADAVREETNANMASMSRDLDGILPPLLAAADSSPGSVTALLPVFRNVDALYDVLLRVTAAADHGAPREQQASLDDALSALEGARHGLGDALAQAAATQDTRVRGLETQLASAPKPQPPPSCPEVHPVHKTVHHRHTAPRSPAKTAPQQ